MSKPNAPKRPADPRARANIYGLAALYLAYLFYKIAKPYLTHDPYGPTTNQFLLGTAVLGGGAVGLGILAWRMYKAPRPEEPMEGDTALPEEAGGDGGEDG
ncbi:hypothetical protein [uncultured Oscillibacter sp.]|uniref:hypothetical protein n=1 Tax=uncultured Oscillibacter sp. TaxID=876091 RepID=UPI0025D00EAE|nr:hypothetical protein [uncultured Oscillibacter sp.]